MNASNSATLAVVNSAKYPIRFERLRPGSLFTIAREVSRNMPRSRDTTVYRRAYDHEGFFAYSNADKSRGIVLMPEDLVQPVRLVRE